MDRENFSSWLLEILGKTTVVYTLVVHSFDHAFSLLELGAPTQISWLPKTWLQNSFQMRSIAYKVFRREKEGVRADSTVTKKSRAL